MGIWKKNRRIKWLACRGETKVSSNGESPKWKDSTIKIAVFKLVRKRKKQQKEWKRANIKYQLGIIFWRQLQRRIPQYKKEMREFLGWDQI